MSRVRILATISLALSLAGLPASSLAQPAPSAPDPEQSTAPGQSAAPPPGAAADQVADPSVNAASPSPTPPAPPQPPPEVEPPTVQPPVVIETEPSLIRFSGYNSLNLGFPMGSVTSNAPLHNMASRALELEGGPDLMIARRVIIGFNVTVGLLALGDEFDASCRAQDVSCRGAIFDAGAHLELLLMPAGSPVVPWIAVEAGYEVLAVSASDGSDVSFLGNQFEIRAGLDFHFREQGGWGPFIAYQRGQYTSQDNSGSANPAGGSMDLPNQAGHGWLLLGLRGRL